MMHRHVGNKVDDEVDTLLDSGLGIGRGRQHPFGGQGGQLGMMDSTTGSLLSDIHAAFSSGRGSSPVVGIHPVSSYSQKNFHISDDALYSVLSPFHQTRRQSSVASLRPSFLRGHSASTASSSSSTTDFGKPTGSSSSKLKFHHVQDFPTDTHTGSSSSSSSSSRKHRLRSSWKFGHSDSDEDDRCRSANATAFGQSDLPPLLTSSRKSSFLSKRLKSRVFKEEQEDEVTEEEEESSHRRHQESFHSSSNDDWDMMDRHQHHKTSSTRMSSSSSSTSSYRRHHHHHCSSSSRKVIQQEDSDPQDDDLPLNLCLADRRMSISSERGGRNDDDDDGQQKRPRSAQIDVPSNDKFASRFSNLLDDFFDQNSIRRSMRRRRHSTSVVFGSEKAFHPSHDDSNVEPSALDLSTTKHGRSTMAKDTGAQHPFSQPQQQQQVYAMTTAMQPEEEAEVDSKFREQTRFPRRISDMLEKMRLQDSDEVLYDTLRRYQATRERLMHTHPELFFSFDGSSFESPRHRSDHVQQDTKPNFSDLLGQQQQQQQCDSKMSPDIDPSVSSCSKNTVPNKMDRDVPFGSHSVLSDFGGAHSEGSNASHHPLSSRSPWMAAPPAPVPPPPPPPSSLDLERNSSASVIHSSSSCFGSGSPYSFSPPPSTFLSPCSSTSEVYPQSRSSSASSLRNRSSSGGRKKAVKNEPLGGGIAGHHHHHHHRISRSRSGSKMATADRGPNSPMATAATIQSSTSPAFSAGSSNNDISICKFKLIKGMNPVLEEKKSFFVPLPRTAATGGAMGGDSEANAHSVQSSRSRTNHHHHPPLPQPQPTEGFRTYKIHIGSQEDMGRKLLLQQQQQAAAAGSSSASMGSGAGRRLRRRSRKALVREKLEATFREQGFLIKTQQVASAEGAVYCKFRQLKKFTRYLYKSWKDHLPKELDDLATTTAMGNKDQGPPPPPPPLQCPEDLPPPTG